MSGTCEAPPQLAACGRTGGLSALTRGWTLWDAQGGALGRLDGTHGQRVLTPPPRCRPGRALGAPEGAPGEGDRAQGCPGCCAHTGRGPRCVPCGIRAPSVERPVADSCRPPPQVVGLRDVLHQARPAARRGHRHRQLLHLPDEQEEGMCRAVWRALLRTGSGCGLCLPPASPLPAPPPSSALVSGVEGTGWPRGGRLCAPSCACHLRPRGRTLGRVGSGRGSFLVRVLVGRGEQPRRLHGSVGSVSRGFDFSAEPCVPFSLPECVS